MSVRTLGSFTKGMALREVNARHVIPGRSAVRVSRQYFRYCCLEIRTKIASFPQCVEPGVTHEMLGALCHDGIRGGHDDQEL